MTGQQGIECTKSSPTKCNKIGDIKTIIQNIKHTYKTHKIIYAVVTCEIKLLKHYFSLR